MQSVTSNAVAKNFLYLKVRNASKNTGDRTYYKITDFFPDIDNTVILVAGHGYCSSGNFEVKASSTNGVDNENSNLITMSGSTFTMQRNTTYSNINFDFFVIKKSMFYERT